MKRRSLIKNKPLVKRPIQARRPKTEALIKSSKKKSLYRKVKRDLSRRQ